MHVPVTIHVSVTFCAVHTLIDTMMNSLVRTWLNSVERDINEKVEHRRLRRSYLQMDYNTIENGKHKSLYAHREETSDCYTCTTCNIKSFQPVNCLTIYSEGAIYSTEDLLISSRWDRSPCLPVWGLKSKSSGTVMKINREWCSILLLYDKMDWNN